MAEKNVPPSKTITDALDLETTRLRIEEGLALPGLFSCSELSQIDALINEEDPEDKPLTSADILTINPKAPVGAETELEKSELAAVSELATALFTENRGVINWEADFQMGASFIAANLWRNPQVQNYYEKICILRPESVEKHYKRALLSIRRELQCTRTEFYDKMRMQRVLLIFLNAESIPEDEATSFLRKFLKKAKDRHQRGDPVSVLMIGKVDIKGLTTPADKTLSSRIAEGLQVAPGARWPFFLRQWRRFGLHRGTHQSEEAGYVIKRAHWHYEAIRARSVWPINIRLRALFATHPTNYVVFDPTAGFEWLVGKGVPLTSDVQLFVDDVRAFLRNREPTFAEQKLRVLRSISTAKYWLSRSALEQLLEEDNSLDVGSVGNSLSTALDDLKPAVTVVPPRTDSVNQDTYVAGIGVKALVQDDWLEKARLDRALAHWRVADRLFKLKHSGTVLLEEFPYDPYWGAGARFYFASETIRHLMRSVQKMDLAKSPPRELPKGATFPEKPFPGQEGCNPAQVVNFCFNNLYQDILNEHEAFPRARALSRRYGAYGLAAEMLQLMSAEGKIGEPHPALSANHRRAFIRESGSALLNIGELKLALDCYRTLMNASSTSSTAESVLDQVNDELEFALILTILERLDNAGHSIESARTKLKSIDPTPLSPESSERYFRISERAAAREVHLAYLTKKPNEVLSLISSLEKQRPKEPDLIHFKIASMMKSDDPQMQEEAFATCLGAVVDHGTRGQHHDALGFRVSLGHMFRAQKRYALAEDVLGSVHKYILKYGCSERTNLAFLVEAGRLLSDQGRMVRAYATYLRIAFLRAAARGFVRDRETAFAHARAALLEIRKGANDRENTAVGSWRFELDKARREDDEYRERDMPKSHGEFARDPLFGYSIAEVEETFARLEQLSGIDSEIEWLDSSAAAARAPL
ncbi:hypothetical protein G6M86_28975 (plasmid) [Agrobacterium tumefaciens]|uniref:Tetratricopeptide repeat protein n=1 Tax=Agrobacterium tumefaciens TaxID=358 RepID=A0AAJ4N8X4_AGRTU|nr:hypothetical protein G6M86_28975 [Agrobacterium tumefaciens]